MSTDNYDTITVTDEDFKRFERRVRYWADLLGLREYRIVCRHSQIDDFYADIDVHEMGKVATIRLTKSVEHPHQDGLDINGHALHEVCHLATYRLFWLSQRRYLLPDDIEEEWEALTRRVGNAIERLTASEAGIAETLARMNSRCASLEVQLADARHELQMRRRKSENEYWCWQDDEYDHVETLTCPILIGPDQMRKILSEHHAAEESHRSAVE